MESSTLSQLLKLPADDRAELAMALSASYMSIGAERIDARELAARLRGYDIQPRLLRSGNDIFRGYRSGDFADAFTRYLPRGTS